MKLMNKKGQVFDSLASLGIGIAVLTITLVVVFLILSKTKSNTTVSADPNATLAIQTNANALADVPTWVPLVVLVFIGTIILGLIKMFR